MVVSSDSIKKATATSHGNSCLLEGANAVVVRGADIAESGATTIPFPECPRVRDHRKMLRVSADPVQALALLPLDPSGQSERQWLQDTLAWLKSVPPRERSSRLRMLAEGIQGAGAVRERFQQIWTRS